MASWSTRRKYGYFFGFIFVGAIVFGLPSYFLFYKAPSCFDGLQNGSERGVDCGGACARLCPADYAPARVLWSHSVKIVPGIYNSLAYAQNPNNGVEAKSVSYLFKLYDDQGILVAERAGYAFIPAGQKFPIFEGAIMTGNRVPARTTFEFTALPNWTPGTALTKLRVLDTTLDQSAKPSAQVTIQNDAVNQSFSNVTAFIVLYDKDDNRVSFSKTLIDSIAAGDKATLFYTWPETFSVNVVRTEVLFVGRPAK
jgi:hypothetical protein